MSTVAVRNWERSDDGSLARILRAQLANDPAWPPSYAHDLDLGDWLGQPADLGRWVCTCGDEIVGHIGLGRLSRTSAQGFSAATGYGARRFAELCRTVVDPDQRRLGIAAVLTRTALKASLGMRRIPVATVLTGRGSWLDMMMNTGWQRVGDVAAKAPDERLVLLLAPQKFVDAAVGDGP